MCYHIKQKLSTVSSYGGSAEKMCDVCIQLLQSSFSLWTKKDQLHLFFMHVCKLMHKILQMTFIFESKKWKFNYPQLLFRKRLSLNLTPVLQALWRGNIKTVEEWSLYLVDYYRCSDWQLFSSLTNLILLIELIAPSVTSESE